MISLWINKIFTRWTLLAIFLLAVTIVTVQSLLSSGIVIENIDQKFTGYNNYLIFKYSFAHLLDYKDLYIYYLDEHWDLFKYTPTFSLLMGPMYYLPDPVGLFVWNAINALLLLWGIWWLPFPKKEWRIGILMIVFIELITSIQNSQANGLMAGLIILAFALLERKKYAWAAFLITLSVFVKPFGVFAYAFFLFHPDKVKNGLYSLLSAVVLWALPLCVVSFGQLIFLYKSWLHLLSWDMDESTGISVQGVLNTWLGLFPNKNHTLLVGIILLVLPLAQYKKWNDFRFKINYLAYLLIWIIIFNHKAESPTFVIAVSGVAIWYVFSPKSVWDTALLTATIVFTVLSPTDLFPFEIRQQYLRPYLVKVVPCILVFFRILIDLFFAGKTKSYTENLLPIEE